VLRPKVTLFPQLM